MRTCFDELRESGILASLKEKLDEYSNFGLGFCGRAPELYIIVRLLRPKIVVETGVGNGVSTTLILSALQRNGDGRLTSIDLPNSGALSVVVPEKDLGWLVPDELKSRWDFKLGRSLDLLPGVLRQLAAVNMFLHDSDHSYAYMLSELRIAWPFVTNGGLLLADDAWDNSAFVDFAREVRKKPRMVANVGAIRK